MRKYNSHPKHEQAGSLGRKGTQLDLSADEASLLLNDNEWCVKVANKRQYVGVTKGNIYVFQDDATGGYHAYPVSSTFSQSVGMDRHESITSNYALDAGQAVHIKGGMNVVIEAGMQLTLKVGGNFVNISQMGVDIQGMLVNINSGGAAGSGAGANPVDPDQPEEAAPTEPDEADNSETGQKSCD